MKRAIKLICFCIVLLIVGCGMAPKGTGPIFKFSAPDAGKAAVYHYRLEKASGGGQFYYLFMNKDFVSIIGNGGYYIQLVLPGEYEYAVKSEVRMPVGLIGVAIDNARAKVKNVYKFSAKPNESYYFRWSCAFGDNVVEKVEESIALKELEGLKKFEPIH